MNRLRELFRKADKAAVIGITAAAVTFMALGAGNEKTYAAETETVTVENAVENGWSADGMYWYENGVKQGTEGRGKEIYDPASDAWYWLDAVQGGKKAISKDVYQESWAGAYADREDGTGKWVRYDENGHMVKGWDETEDGTYYFDIETGAMAKGTTDIDGVSCRFDVYTGVGLDKAWAEENGALYWYESGVRQGTKGRGKEIYDAGSDAWYWLDAVDNGKKAVSKDVYQESWAGAYADREDGTGKWVRYDENGKMIKGWDSNQNGKYYFDPETGAMAKGKVLIDSVMYSFDKNTGIGTVDLDTNGLVFDGTTDKWWYFNAGVIDYSFNGLCSNEYGTWKIAGGTIDYNYTGAVDAEDGRWYVAKGKVRTNKPNVKVIDGPEGLMYDEPYWYTEEGWDRGYGESVYQGADIDFNYPLLTVTTKYCDVVDRGVEGNYNTYQGYYYIAIDADGNEVEPGFADTFAEKTGHHNYTCTKVGTYSCGDVWFCAYRYDWEK